MAPVTTTTATTTYTARCTREGKWWVVHVPEIDHSTQARRLDQVPETVADLVSLFTDLDPADVTVHVTVAWPEALATLVAEVEAARADAEARAAAAADLRLALAADLTREGLSVRDIARVLGVSHQRVAQLLAQHDTTDPAGAAGTPGTG